MRSFLDSPSWGKLNRDHPDEGKGCGMEYIDEEIDRLLCKNAVKFLEN